MSHREFKSSLYGQFARVGAALSSERRLELIELLAQAPRNVDALASECGMTVANTSRHLQLLKQARLVESDRDGTRVVYRLADDSVIALWMALRATGESRLAEIGDLARRHDLRPDGAHVITARELEEMRRAGDVVLIDVRPAEEYEHGHLGEALSLPIEELEARLDELPNDRRIVAYCRGSYCLFAHDAVALLRERGFDAYRLSDGWVEWWASHRAAPAVAHPRG